MRSDGRDNAKKTVGHYFKCGPFKKIWMGLQKSACFEMIVKKFTTMMIMTKAIMINITQEQW